MYVSWPRAWLEWFPSLVHYPNLLKQPAKENVRYGVAFCNTCWAWQFIQKSQGIVQLTWTNDSPLIRMLCIHELALVVEVWVWRGRMQICVYGIIYSSPWLHKWTPELSVLIISRFHLLDACAEEGIVQVHLAGSPQVHIWRALRLQETRSQARRTACPWISNYVSLGGGVSPQHLSRSQAAGCCPDSAFTSDITQEWRGKTRDYASWCDNVKEKSERLRQEKACSCSEWVSVEMWCWMKQACGPK